MHLEKGTLVRISEYGKSRLTKYGTLKNVLEKPDQIGVVMSTKINGFWHRVFWVETQKEENMYNGFIERVET